MNLKTKVIKTKNQVVVGKQTYVNQYTGEQVEMTVIQKNINSDFNFHKIWLGDILQVLDTFGNKKLKILTFLLKEMRDSDNSISVTYNYINKMTEISTETIRKTMTELMESKVITKVRTGLYMFNPDLIIKGNSDKRQRLLIEYNRTDNNDNLSVIQFEEEVKQIVLK